jgi:signal transduction protein with GAF and PtsI domain
LEGIVPGETKKINSLGAEQELKLLSELSNLVQKSDDERKSIEVILQHLGKIIDFRSASLYLFSKENGKLEEACTVGRKVDLIEFVSFDMGSGISAWVAKHKRPILLNNLRKSKGGTHTKSFLSVPVLFTGEVLGVLNLAHDEPDSFTRHDVEVASIASSLTTLLLERIKHKEVLTEKNKEIDQLSNEVKSAKKGNPIAESIPITDNLASSINQKMENPLAIIAGNAQFLMMTIKSSNPSIIKRLKAIDREASNLMTYTHKLLNQPSEGDRGITYILKEESSVIE